MIAEKLVELDFAAITHLTQPILMKIFAWNISASLAKFDCIKMVGNHTLYSAVLHEISQQPGQVLLQTIKMVGNRTRCSAVLVEMKELTVRLKNLKCSDWAKLNGTKTGHQEMPL